MAEIKLEHVYKTYRSKGKSVEAVRDLNLVIHEGEFMVLLGPSGCGKTTTLRMIVGLEEISRGRLFIGERLANDLTPQERNVAMAFETYALYNHLSVQENLLFPLKARKVPRDEQAMRLEKIADMLEIQDILQSKPMRLSGGQQQRVSLGRALIRTPDVFLLDEPLSHLDVTLRIATRNRIKRLHAELGTTMIHVTHDQLEAIALADRIAVMNFAELQQVGTPRELIDEPVNLFVAGFVGEPAINLLPGTIVVEDDMMHVDCGERIRFKLNSAYRHAVSAGSHKEVIVGIRPHDLLICPEGESDLSGQVEVSEFLGEQKQVTFSINDFSLSSVLPPEVGVAGGQPIHFRVHPERLHLFDKNTEQRLRL